MSTPEIPAGWQPDPRGRHEYRYWDGTQWTDHVSNQGEVSSDPVADASPAAAAAETAPATEVQPAAVTPEPEPEPVVASEPDPVIERQPDPVIERQSEPVVERQHDPIVASEPVAATTPPTGSAAPPGGTTTPSTHQTDAKAAAQEVLSSRDPDLATILTATVPGSGHFYMGAANAVPIGAALLVATLLAVVLSYFSFILFLVGFVIWLGAVIFGLMDLRGGPESLLNVSLKPNVVGVLLIAAGALLIISLLLPYYHAKGSVSISGGGVGSLPGLSGDQSQSVNGSGFEAFGIIDILLLVVGIASIVSGAAALGLGPVTAAELPKQLPMIVAVGGAIAVILLLFRMFVDPVGNPIGNIPDVPGVKIDADFSVGRAFGIWIGLWSAMLIALANLGILRSLGRQDHQTV